MYCIYSISSYFLYQIPAQILKVPGEAGETIVAKAHELKADMIVTGTRGLGTIRRTIIGSVSDYILHHSDVPVFVCRHYKYWIGDIFTILVKHCNG